MSQSTQVVDISDDEIEAVRAAARKQQPTVKPVHIGGTATAIPAHALENKPSPLMSIAAENLPSGGLSYPKGTHAFYQKYSFAEVEAISRSQLTEDQEYGVLIAGIELKVGDENITKKLVSADGDYLIIQRKLNSLGINHEGVLSVPCPQCGNPVTKNLKLTEIEFEELTEKIKALPIRYELADGMKLTFGLPTVTNVQEGLAQQIPDDKIVAYTLACMIQNDRDGRSRKDIISIIEKVTDPDDRENLHQIYQMATGYLPPIKLSCSGTPQDLHEPREILIPIQEVSRDIFKPFPDADTAPRRKIQFGSETT